MFRVLDQLIGKLLSSYDSINEILTNMDGYAPVNLKKKSIIDIQKDSQIWDCILKYRKFMMMHQIEILMEIDTLYLDTANVTSRIKELNSIEDKINRYVNGQLQGKVPINKCLNDLFGVRIIMNESFAHDDLVNHMSCLYPNLKLTNASKNNYIASHIYIMTANQFFPWELQIWKKEDEKNNFESHKLYKQGYVTWQANYKKQ